MKKKSKNIFIPEIPNLEDNAKKYLIRKHW